MTTGGEGFEHDAPLQDDAPWPTYRRTARNTGSTPLAGEYRGDQPWFFQTGKGIFSTPVVDGDGVVYVGSADHDFYAVDPDGTEKWRFRTGEMIDSAGALPADDPDTVVFGSGDGRLYRLDKRDGSVVWRFDARISPRMSYNNWFEGNVAIGPDGTIYAGNTNFNYYAVTPDGELAWVYETGSNAWSAPAVGSDGTLYVGSCDTCLHAIHPDGSRKWKRRTLGFISASAAIGRDGTIYAGSFDSHLYALDPDTGKTRWKYTTADHIYASAALLEDGTDTTAIIVGSTDGIMYALSPHGESLWQYDTGAPIRSSPVIGRDPGGEGHVVTFGNGDGRLFALDAATGERRWSYDTTGAGGASPDRNDLNGSPALGTTGIYIGGEHGQLWYVPYDYPLHHPEDPRGAAGPAEELPADTISLYPVTPGGRVQADLPARLPAATIICLKLIVWEGGTTLPARFSNPALWKRSGPLRIRFEPAVPFRWEVSGDGRYLYVIPEGLLHPGADYSLTVAGEYYLGGVGVGNLTIGGRSRGSFEQRFRFSVEESGDAMPLRIGEDDVTAFEWTRLAVPIPTMLPSLNQIGFDSMHWIVAPVVLGPDGKAVLWAIGGQRDQDGELVVDVDTDFRLPLSGRIQGDAFILTNHHFVMGVTGIPIPFTTFEIRGRMGQDLRVLPGARAYAETKVLSIPTFGIPMVIAGLANRIWRKLVAMATYLTNPYPAGGTANRRPAGVGVEVVTHRVPGRSTPGTVTATLRIEPGHTYPADRHLGAILLVDAATNDVVPLDYHHNLRQTEDDAGNLSRIELTIPKKARLPEKVVAHVLVDVFAVFSTRLDAGS
jgi:outer membrane protein assembly factor BamB